MVVERKLAEDGITTIGQLRARDERELVARYGAIGRRLIRFARGEDDRAVVPDAPTKSISVETTFTHDLASFDALMAELEPLARELAERLVRHGLAAGGVTLKLKTSGFKIVTRSRALSDPTQRAEVLLRAARPLLEEAATGASYRLIGIGSDRLADPVQADPPDLFAADTSPVTRRR
jgi:DNA polymerase-4